MTATTEEMIEYIPHLRRFARSLVRDQDRADDLVQDCLERTIERLDQFRPGTNMRAWLFKIMHSLHINHYRKQARRGQEVEFEEWYDGAGSEPTQYVALEMRDFRRMVAKMPSASREVLMLVGAEGFSYEEAAEVLGIPTGTVRSRLSRAREMLRNAQSARQTAGAKPRGGRPDGAVRHAA